MSALLNINNLSLHADAQQLRCLIRGLNFSLEHKQSCALLGRNGCGKTSLLHSIAGIRSEGATCIELENKPLSQWSRMAMGRTLGLLFQEQLETMPATVLETVMLGRHPHSESVFWDSDKDRELAQEALAVFELESLAQRQVSTLSGGERQRLGLAMLQTQEPLLYLLDEPNNHLDVAFQLKLLDRLSARIAACGASMLIATHDINLAARYCEKTLLLMGDGSYVTGPSDQVLNAENLSRAFDHPIQSTFSEEYNRKIFFPA